MNLKGIFSFEANRKNCGQRNRFVYKNLRGWPLPPKSSGTQYVVPRRISFTTEAIRWFANGWMWEGCSRITCKSLDKLDPEIVIVTTWNHASGLILLHYGPDAPRYARAGISRQSGTFKSRNPPQKCLFEAQDVLHRTSTRLGPRYLSGLFALFRIFIASNLRPPARQGSPVEVSQATRKLVWGYGPIFVEAVS